MPQPHDPRWNRDNEQKPSRPQRTATEPKGAEGSSESDKSVTDPASGEQRRGGHAPNQAQADQTDGAGRISNRKP